MATITETLLHNEVTTPVTNNLKPNNQSMRVCFSFAAYSKTLMDHLKNNKNIAIQQGLSEAEFSYIESSLHFTFPPDLRSILREGLPVAPGFPNWRSASRQQLKILTSLPKLGILKQVSRSELWFESWGVRPRDPETRLDLAEGFLNGVTILIPVYKNFYLPCSPNLAGNPVFCVDGLSVGVSGFDLSGFFVEVGMMSSGPAWAAKAARRIEFWSEMVEFAEGLAGCVKAVYWQLRCGGWNEDEVKDMMMKNNDNGGNCEKNNGIIRDMKKKVLIDDDDDDDTLYWTFDFNNLTIN